MANVNPAQLKERSEERLRQEGVPINAALPVIETLAELNVAPSRNVRARCLALSAVFARAFGAKVDLVSDWVSQNGIDQGLNEPERQFIRTESPDEAECRRLHVQVEALWELAWVVEVVDRMDHFAPCANNLVHLIPKPGEDPTQFLQSSPIRPESTLHAEADYLYRLHWAVRDAALRGDPPPNGLPEYVTHNRLHAINWVMQHDVEWGEVDVST